MNEFSKELEEFIEETVKKSVDEHTAEVIEKTVKKVLGKYCLETNNNIELLMTVVNTLMNILSVKRFPSTEELKALMNKAMADKATELNKRNFGEKSEEPKS